MLAVALGIGLAAAQTQFDISRATMQTVLLIVGLGALGIAGWAAWSFWRAWADDVGSE